MPPSAAALRRRFLGSLAACAVLTLLAIAFVDRPSSTWSHVVLRRAALFDWLTHIVDPLPWGSVIGLLAGGTAVALGWRPGEAGKTALACCVTVATTITVKDQLKTAFGRTWPETWTNHNPSWISNRAFGFHPFHGGQGWFSFPSGHTTLITCLAAVLWIRSPGLRWLAAALVVLVVVGLYGSDFHWIGDMVAGGFLGTACAVGVLAFGGLLPRRDGRP